MQWGIKTKFLDIAEVFILVLIYSAALQMTNGIAMGTNSDVISSPLIGRPAIAANKFPVGIAVNSVTNMVYVTSPFSNTLSKINGNSDNLVNTTLVGALPYGVDVDPVINRIYVANYFSDEISVVDGGTNTIVRKITNISRPVDIKVDPVNSWIYVTNINNDTVSKIDAITDEINDTAKVGTQPYSLDIKEGKDNKIYVTNLGSDSVSVIDGDSFETLKNITVDKSPVGVAASPYTNKVYVSNRESDTVSVIDGVSDTVVKNLTVGHNPEGIDINSSTNMVYVSNTGSNTLSVINGSSDEIIKTIQVNINTKPVVPGRSPPILKFPNLATFIGINYNTSSIYVTNPASNTVSPINGTTNELWVGIRFAINPPNSGSIKCNEHNIQTDYIRFDFGANVSCEGVPNDGFIFSSWSKGKLSSSQDNPLLFTANEYGSRVVNFKPVSPPIPPEYLAPLYGIIATSIIGWSWTSIVGWIKGRIQRIHLKECINQIGKLDKNAIDKKVITYYVEGKITEDHRELLKDKISEYYDNLKDSSEQSS